MIKSGGCMGRRYPALNTVTSETPDICFIFVEYKEEQTCPPPFFQSVVDKG